MNSPTFHWRGRRHAAFTLVELLVVIGIVVLLISILMPAVVGARVQSATIQCASNVRQITTALINYSAANRGLFPPNKTDPAYGLMMSWYDNSRIGRYLPGKEMSTGLSASGHSPMGGPIFTCSGDDRSSRSYSMNIWACSEIDPGVITTPTPQGALWRGSGRRMTSNVILVTERWSTAGTTALGFYAPATVGAVGSKPGPRFGVLSGVTISNTHWKPNPTSELPYQWHRRRGDGGGGTQAYGRVNIGYIDGHVETKSVTDLASRTTGLSTLDSLWSPIDRELNY